MDGMKPEQEKYKDRSHLEADDVAEKFARSVANHGDSSDDTVLAEEAPEDHVPLPDVGQVPGLQEDLVGHGLVGESVPGERAVYLAVSHPDQAVLQAGGGQAGGEL